MLNDVALVVSVKNKTVITAMDGASAKIIYLLILIVQ